MYINRLKLKLIAVLSKLSFVIIIILYIIRYNNNFSLYISYFFGENSISFLSRLPLPVHRTRLYAKRG